MRFSWTFATLGFVLSADALKVSITQVKQNDGGNAGSSGDISGVKSATPKVLAVSAGNGGLDLSCVSSSLAFYCGLK